MNKKTFGELKVGDTLYAFMGTDVLPVKITGFKMREFGVDLCTEKPQGFYQSKGNVSTLNKTCTEFPDIFEKECTYYTCKEDADKAKLENDRIKNNRTFRYKLSRKSISVTTLRCEDFYQYMQEICEKLGFSKHSFERIDIKRSVSMLHLKTPFNSPEGFIHVNSDNYKECKDLLEEGNFLLKFMDNSCGCIDLLLLYLWNLGFIETGKYVFLK